MKPKEEDCIPRCFVILGNTGRGKSSFINLMNSIKADQDKKVEETPTYNRFSILEIRNEVFDQREAYNDEQSITKNSIRNEYLELNKIKNLCRNNKTCMIYYLSAIDKIRKEQIVNILEHIRYIFEEAFLKPFIFLIDDQYQINKTKRKEFENEMIKLIQIMKSNFNDINPQLFYFIQRDKLDDNFFLSLDIIFDESTAYTPIDIINIDENDPELLTVLNQIESYKIFTSKILPYLQHIHDQNKILVSELEKESNKKQIILNKIKDNLELIPKEDYNIESEKDEIIEQPVQERIDHNFCQSMKKELTDSMVDTTTKASSPPKSSFLKPDNEKNIQLLTLQPEIEGEFSKGEFLLKQKEKHIKDLKSLIDDLKA